MRTTLTLDPDVEKYIRDACHAQKKTFKQVVNEAIRASLQPKSEKLPELLPAKGLGWAPGVDPRKLKDLDDEMEMESFLAAEAKARYGNAKDGNS